MARGNNFYCDLDKFDISILIVTTHLKHYLQLDASVSNQSFP